MDKDEYIKKLKMGDMYRMIEMDLKSRPYNETPIIINEMVDKLQKLTITIVLDQAKCKKLNKMLKKFNNKLDKLCRRSIWEKIN